MPEFDKVVFKLPTKTVTAVNTKQYGWFVVQPTGAITASKKTPVAQAGKQIQQQLLTEKKNAFMTTWVDQHPEELLHRREGQVPGRLRAEP